MTQTHRSAGRETALRELKAAARKTALARRAAAHGVADSAPARAALEAELLAIAPRIVAGYMAMRSEIDPMPAMRRLHAAGMRICVPVIAGKGRPLDFREWTPAAEMIDGPFGARVPAAGDWLTPEALIVPLVAFDPRLNRLGYGGGFYDRTLEKLRARRPTQAIGFAYAAQQAELLPLEPTDQPLDALVTEKSVLRPPS